MIPAGLATALFQIIWQAGATGNGRAAIIAAILIWTGCVIIMIFTAFTHHPRLLAHPLVRFAGLLSYPLYLLHQMIGTALLRQFQEAGATPATATIAAALTVFCIAIGVTMFAEPWLRRSIGNLLG